MEDSKFPENKQSINNVKPNINFPRTKAQHDLLPLHLAQEKNLTASLRLLMELLIWKISVLMQITRQITIPFFMYHQNVLVYRTVFGKPILNSFC